MPKARKPKRGRTDDDQPDARAPDQSAISHGTKRSHSRLAGWNEAFDELSPCATRIAKEQSHDHDLRIQMGSGVCPGPSARSARALGAGGSRSALQDAP